MLVCGSPNSKRVIVNPETLPGYNLFSIYGMKLRIDELIFINLCNV